MAVASLAGIPLFFFSVSSVLLLPAGPGVLLAPESLLAVRRLASGQRLRGQLRYCRWLLADPATWRELLWMLVGWPVRLPLGQGRRCSPSPARGCWGRTWHPAVRLVEHGPAVAWIPGDLAEHAVLGPGRAKAVSKHPAEDDNRRVLAVLTCLNA